MAATNNYLISYDISSNRTRNLLAKLLAKLGCVRWQKSVFVAIDFEKTDLEQLKTQTYLQELHNTKHSLSKKD